MAVTTPLWDWLQAVPRHRAPWELLHRALCTSMCQDGVCWGGGWKGGVRRSGQIGADCPIIVDNEAFQQGHKSMADGDTMGGGY